MDDKREIFQLVRDPQPIAGPAPMTRADAFYLADRIEQLAKSIDRLAAIVARTSATGNDGQ